MRQRSEGRAFASDRDIHRTEVCDDWRPGHRGDDGRLGELERRSGSTTGAARLMEKRMTVRADEAEPADRNVRGTRHA